jgi:hypothetical protein
MEYILSRQPAFKRAKANNMESELDRTFNVIGGENYDQEKNRGAERR